MTMKRGTMRRGLLLAVLVVAIAALAVPMIGLRASASASGVKAKPMAAVAKAAASVAGPVEPAVEPAAASVGAQSSKIPRETLEALGIGKSLTKKERKAASGRARARIASVGASANVAATPLTPSGQFANAGTIPGGGSGPKGNGEVGPPLIGQPVVLNSLSALSAAVITNIGGRDTQFSEVALVADWDGREDCAADRGTKVDDFSLIEP
ncbi:MAG TPA: hypothetical protein VLU47_18775, partial [Blastocatellia bacterium]|nr:hypothetical protein [Blastocatellia bacterium]